MYEGMPLILLDHPLLVGTQSNIKFEWQTNRGGREKTQIKGEPNIP